MKLSVFSLCLCLVLTQATPFDLLRQQAVRATKLASDPAAAAAAAAPTDASLSFLEKQQELAFEMEKEDSSKHSIAEADAVDNLAQAEVQEAAQQSQQQGQQQQQQTTTTTTTTTETQQQQQQTAAQTTQKASAKTEEKKADKPMQWEDAVLVEDLTKERASADANTKFIGANMKSTRVGTLKEPRQNQQQQQPKATSFLQMGAPLYYYPVHPAFLQQQQRLSQQHQQQTTEGRSAEGAKTQGWGDYGTPLYWAEQYGSYDGLGAAGANMYGNFGYAPYASGYDPAYTQAAGGASMVGASPYYNPYGGGYGTPFNIPSPPPMPTDLPLPPYIQPAQRA